MEANDLVMVDTIGTIMDGMKHERWCRMRGVGMTVLHTKRECSAPDRRRCAIATKLWLCTAGVPGCAPLRPGALATRWRAWARAPAPGQANSQDRTEVLPVRRVEGVEGVNRVIHLHGAGPP